MKKRNTSIVGKCGGAFLILGAFISMGCPGRAWAVTTNGLAAWYKADTVVAANGAPVPTWADNSPGNHAGTATAFSGNPTFNTGDASSGFQPFLDFNGGAHYRSGNFLGITNDIAATIFVVYRPDSDTAGNAVFSLGNVNTGPAHAFGMYNNATSPSQVAMHGGSSTPVYFGDAETTNFQIVQVSKTNGPLNSTTMMWWNGLNLSVQGGSSSATPSVDDQPLLIGGWGISGSNPGTAAAFLNGDIAEIIVYNGVLNSNDALQVTYYLGDKYMITVPEPTGAVLMGVAGVTLLWRQRRG